MSNHTLASARYGKDMIRLLRVVRSSEREAEEKKFHTVVEYNVTVLVEGDIATSYTQADNSVIVATDSSESCCVLLTDM